MLRTVDSFGIYELDLEHQSFAHANFVSCQCMILADEWMLMKASNHGTVPFETVIRQNCQLQDNASGFVYHTLHPSVRPSLSSDICETIDVSGHDSDGSRLTTGGGRNQRVMVQPVKLPRTTPKNVHCRLHDSLHDRITTSKYWRLDVKPSNDDRGDEASRYIRCNRKTSVTKTVPSESLAYDDGKFCLSPLCRELTRVVPYGSVDNHLAWHINHTLRTPSNQT